MPAAIIVYFVWKFILHYIEIHSVELPYPTLRILAIYRQRDGDICSSVVQTIEIAACRWRIVAVLLPCFCRVFAVLLP